jgi:myo-inositol catabolism protein IolC
MKKPEKLFILPFDHRSYFLKKSGVIDREPTDAEKDLVRNNKKLIYQAFQKSLELGIPKESAAILVDDIYGKEILIDAKQNGYTTIQTTEISGLDYFAFEHGDDAENFLVAIMPHYAKALVRLDPRNNTVTEQTSITNLKKLNDICKKNNIGFLIEPLFFPNADDVAKFGDDKRLFDEQVRPVLVQQLMDILYAENIRPDIWKIEGFSQSENYQSVADHLLTFDPDARIVVLGRNETPEFVAKWITAGKSVPSVIGFAVGRTVFDAVLDDHQSGTISESQAVEKIAQNFYHYYQLFME